MKTVSSKLEVIAVNLGLQPNDYRGVVRYLVNILKYSQKASIQLNAISSNVICNLVLSVTGVQITRSNLSVYKNNGCYLIQDIAEHLNIIEVQSARCCLSQVNGQWVMEPEKSSAIFCFQMLIKNCSTSQMMTDCYEMWRNKGMSVGDKRYWPSPKLVKFLIEHQLALAFPISHSKPKQLKRIFNFLTTLIEKNDLSYLPNRKLNDYIDEEVRKFSYMKKITTKLKPWIDSSMFNVDIDYVNSIPAMKRTSPYFYMKLSKKRAKIGSADNSNRFGPKDIGIVVCLETRACDNFAYEVERKVREYLKCFDLHPDQGKIDHYSIPLKSLVNLAIGFIFSNSKISQRIRSITATYEH